MLRIPFNNKDLSGLLSLVRSKYEYKLKAGEFDPHLSHLMNKIDFILMSTHSKETVYVELGGLPMSDKDKCIKKEAATPQGASQRPWWENKLREMRECDTIAGDDPISAKEADIMSAILADAVGMTADEFLKRTE